MKTEMPSIYLREFGFDGPDGFFQFYSLHCDENECSLKCDFTTYVVGKEGANRVYAYQLFGGKHNLSGKRFALYHTNDFLHLLDSFEQRLQNMVLAGAELEAVKPVVNMIESINSMVGRTKECLETTCVRKRFVESPVLYNWESL